MSERDRQNPYERDQQFGSGNRGSSGQANQWQGGNDRQQGGDWQQDGGQRGGSDDYTRDYRFSGQGSSQDDAQDYRGGDSQSYGRGQGQRSSGGGYRSQLNDDDLRGDQRDASRNFERARGGYGPHHDRGRQQDWQRGSNQGGYGQRSNGPNYAGHDYDASGGNDFGSFTSEDFGGRDFSNRGGGAMGGMRSSESYRPSYGLSSWLRGDDDRDGRIGQGSSGARGQSSGHEDYGSWRQYGESRGFLQRAGDEVASWFGDEEATRRREQDQRQSLGQGQGQGQGQSHRGRGPSNYTRSDERIREDANDHLTHDHHVDATHIHVSVKDGELTLDGTVESREAKRRAEDAVEHISGVKHVQNNLRVQDRSAGSTSAGLSGGSSAGSSYGQSSSSGSTGQSGSSSLGGTSTTTAPGSTSGASSGTTGSSMTTAAGQSSGATGASTTSGIGSTASAGAGAASAPRSSDKTT